MANTIVQNPIEIQRSKETASDLKNQSGDVGDIQTRKDKSRKETKWIWNKEGWEVNSSENITTISQKKMMVQGPGIRSCIEEDCDA